MWCGPASLSTLCQVALPDSRAREFAEPPRKELTGNPPQAHHARLHLESSREGRFSRFGSLAAKVFRAVRRKDRRSCLRKTVWRAATHLRATRWGEPHRSFPVHRWRPKVHSQVRTFPVITRQAFVFASEFRGSLRRDHPGALSAGKAFVQASFSRNAGGKFENPVADWRTTGTSAPASRTGHGADQRKLPTLSKLGPSPWPSPECATAIHPKALIFEWSAKWCGLGKFRQRAGTTPPLAAARLRARWSFPPCWLASRKQNRISSYLELIWKWSGSRRIVIGGRESHGQDQIEKGASRITSVCRGGPLLHHAWVQQRVPTHARLYL